MSRIWTFKGSFKPICQKNHETIKTFRVDTAYKHKEIINFIGI